MTAETQRPWIKSYRLGPYKLAHSLEPYPEEPLFTLLDQSAARYPGSTAIDYFGERISYQELKSYADSLACALAAFGVKKGDKVATILPTCPQYIIANFGILKTGATHVPCSILHKERDLEFEIGESEAETVICLEEQLERVLNVKPKTKLKQVIVTALTDYTPTEQEQPEAADGIYRFKTLIAETEPKPPTVEINPREDLAYVVKGISN